MRKDDGKMKTRPVRYFAAAMQKYKNGFYVFYAILILAMMIQPFIGMFGPRMMIDEIMGSAETVVIVKIAAVMILADFAVKTITSFINEELDKLYYPGLDRHLEAAVGKKSMELKYETTENKETLDALADARTGIDTGYSGGSKGLFGALAVSIVNIVVLILSAFVVCRYSFIPLLFVAVNVSLNAFFESRLNRIKIEQIQQLAVTDRAYHYLLHGLSDIRYGKDIRLFNAKAMMLGRVDEFNDRQSEINKTHAKRAQKYVMGSKINQAVTAALTYLLFALMVADKKISIGDFTMLAAAVTTIVTAINLVLRQILELKKFCTYSDKFIRYVEGNAYEEKGEREADTAGETVIEFKNVYFKYPGSTEYALKNINATIRSGEKWSVVGLNGAGKSTFIKLICRLYECTEGEILLNGRNITDYEYNSYMKTISAVFQDFCLLNFSIKENIICDSPDKAEDESLIALLEEVGLKDKVDSLP